MARFLIDPERSRVTIDASSSVHPIHTETGGLEGWIDVGAASGHVEFPVDRLRSGNPLEDVELRRRIDARRFPTIAGELTSLEPDGSEGRYRAGGDVTFRGVTLHFEDDLDITVSGSTLRVAGASRFDVRDFGMRPPRILLLRVHPEVDVRIDVVAEAET